MSNLTVEHNNTTRHLILNRVACSNAFDDVLIEQLTDAFIEAEQDERTRSIILRAHGKHFSAGADVHWMQRMRDYTETENIADAKKLATLMHTIYACQKPTIALVQGAAFGGGAGLVACCDMAIASVDARFCFSEVKLGLIPAVISPYVIAAIGARQAKRLFLTAEIINAPSALQLALVTQLVPENDLLTTGIALGETLANNAPRALLATKRLVSEVQGREITPSLIDMTAKTIAAIRCQAEGQEGLSAFLEKREPQWRSHDV